MEFFWKISFTVLIMAIMLLSAWSPLIAVMEYLFTGLLISLVAYENESIYTFPWKLIFAWLPALWSDQILDWTLE